MLFVLWFVTAIAFTLTRLAPGDPSAAMLGADATPAEVTAFKKTYGLDGSIPSQYIIWMGHVLQGDLGQSIYLGRPVTTAILERLPVTLTLTVFAFLLAVLIGVPLGIVAAYKKNTVIDRTASTVAVLGLSLPSFWIGIYMILFFSVRLRWLPSGGFVAPWSHPVDGVGHLLLPGLALGYLQAGLIARMTRSSVLDTLNLPFVQVARAKGLAERVVVAKHVLKNAILPVISVMGVSLAVLFGGSVVIETVFTIPGVGRLMVSAVTKRDFPVIQGALLLIATWYALVNLLADIAYTVVDPRIRYA